MGARSLLIFDPQQLVGDHLTRVVADWPDPVPVQSFDQFRALAEAIEHGPHHLGLVAAIADDVHESLSHLRIVHEEYPGLPIVLILPRGFWLEPAELVRVGAIELLPDNVDHDELNASLQRAVRIGLTASQRAAIPESAPATAEQNDTLVLSLLSPVGGAGRTFLSINAACWLAGETDKRVCLLDLGGPYGAATTALRLRADFTVAQAAVATENWDEMADHLSDYMVRSEHGFDVLAAGESSEDWAQLTSSNLAALLELLIPQYDAVVIDCPIGFDPLTIQALRVSTALSVVGTLDVPTLRSMRLFLSEIRGLEFDESAIHVVINRSTGSLGIEVAEAIGYLGTDQSSWIPTDTEVRRSMNRGSPIVVEKPTHAVSRHITNGLQRIVWQHGATDDEPPALEPKVGSKWFPALTRSR